MKDGYCNTDIPFRGYRVKLVYEPFSKTYHGYWTYPNRPVDPTSERVGISPEEVLRSQRNGAWLPDIPAHVALPQGV